MSTMKYGDMWWHHRRQAERNAGLMVRMSKRVEIVFSEPACPPAERLQKILIECQARFARDLGPMRVRLPVMSEYHIVCFTDVLPYRCAGCEWEPTHRWGVILIDGAFTLVFPDAYCSPGCLPSLSQYVNRRTGG